MTSTYDLIKRGLDEGLSNYVASMFKYLADAGASPEAYRGRVDAFQATLDRVVKDYVAAKKYVDAKSWP